MRYSLPFSVVDQAMNTLRYEVRQHRYASPAVTVFSLCN